MPRPNTTADADATGFKTCTICHKRKVASRDPSESCFYLITTPNRRGHYHQYYMSCCKLCCNRRHAERTQADGGVHARNSRLRMLADPVRKARYNAGKAAYYRRNRERQLRVKTAYRRSAIGKLIYARWQNNKRLKSMIAADEASNAPQNSQRIARLKELIAAQDAEITRIKQRKQAEEASDVNPKMHEFRMFQRLTKDIRFPLVKHANEG